MPSIKTLILGIGNTLLSDEGAGIHTIHYLQQNYPPPPGVTYLDGGTLSFTLASSIEEANHLIIIDAAKLGKKPGSLYTFVDHKMDQFLSTRKLSIHEISLIDLMDITRLTNCLPIKRALIGIQPEKLNWGDRTSNSVTKAIPKAAKQALLIAKTWQEITPR